MKFRNYRPGDIFKIDPIVPLTVEAETWDELLRASLLDVGVLSHGGEVLLIGAVKVIDTYGLIGVIVDKKVKQDKDRFLKACKGALKFYMDVKGLEGLLSPPDNKQSNFLKKLGFEEDNGNYFKERM